MRRTIRSLTAPALQWPRSECRDPDGEEFLADNAVPMSVIDATCELARELIVEDRTRPAAGEGLRKTWVGGTGMEFDKRGKRQVIPPLVARTLSQFGSQMESRSGSVRLVRA